MTEEWRSDPTISNSRRARTRRSAERQTPAAAQPLAALAAPAPAMTNHSVRSTLTRRNLENDEPVLTGLQGLVDGRGQAGRRPGRRT